MMKKWVLLFIVKFSVKNQFASGKINIYKSMCTSDDEQGIKKLQPM